MFEPELNQTLQIDYILLQITASSAAGLQTLQVYILYAVYRSADSTGLQTLHLTTDDCQFYRSTDSTGLLCLYETRTVAIYNRKHMNLKIATYNVVFQTVEINHIFSRRKFQ